ncbi:MAG TPA: ATP-binding protein, partial [Pseudomonadales bacterium]|nr:ATP-binding protein [Pseudomonadales bacterium]
FAEMWSVPTDLLDAGMDGAVLQSVLDKVVDPDAFVARVRDLYGRHDVVAQEEVELLDGRIFDRYTAPMYDPEGRYYGRIWYFRDITEQHQTTQALRIAEERMRFALESAGVGIWDFDGATRELRASELLESQYGLPPGTFERTEEAFFRLVHPDDRDQLMETIRHAMNAGTGFSEQHRSVWPDGTVRWLTGAGRFIVDEQGTLVRGVGITLDITDQRELELQYSQAQKMEAVGQLAGGIAHDFNNLLTLILGYCEILLEDRGPEGPDWTEISEIRAAGLRAAALTGQLLAFSRKQIIAPAQLDLNVIVEEMRDMLSRLIAENIEIVVDLAPNLGAVLADRGQIEQVIMNLAVNARDAMPEGGKLLIETRNTDLDDQYAREHVNVSAGHYVELAVSDTGTGIPPEIKDKLFEPFFTTKEEGKGTGLGLATVHGIVLRAGGDIEVDSELGQGTSFRVHLPRGDERPERPPLQTTHPDGGNETVLVVEDGDALRGLTRRQLERRGYSVITASSAKDALRVCDANRNIDVLLTDVVMPGSSGPELATQLLERLPNLKVVYMSGFTEDTIVGKGILNPDITFLQKPFTSEQLSVKIREVLDAQ